MIQKMLKLTLCGLDEEKGRMISQLMRLGCVQVRGAEDMEDFEQIRDEVATKTVDLYSNEQTLSRLGSAIALLKPFEGKKKLFAKKMAVDYDHLESEQTLDDAKRLCEQVELIARDVNEIKGQRNKAQFGLTSLLPWRKLDVDLSDDNTENTVTNYYIFPAATDLGQLEQQLEEKVGCAVMLRVGEDAEQKYVAVVTHRSAYDQQVDLLKEYNVIKLDFSQFSGSVAHNIDECQARVDRLDQQLKEFDEKLAELATGSQVIKSGFDAAATRLECQKTYRNMLHTECSFLATTWIPLAKREQVEDALQQYRCYYAIEEPAKGEEYPILLKNNKFVRSGEIITEMYALPSSLSIDPNFMVTPFFILFFGMMLSDAGYGLIIIIAALLAMKKIQMRPPMRSTMRLVLYCGISTVFWGAVYGGWFGDIISVVGKTYFNADISVPMLIDPLKDPITILIMSLVMGVVHVFCGMALKAYILIKRGHPWEAFFDVGLWYILIIGLPMMLLPGVFSTIGMVMAIGAAVGLVLTQGREAKNVFMKLGKGIMSLYDLVGYLSDILSYSRILALGMATGVMAQVFNLLGSLGGPNIIGVLVMIVVFAAGHALNFAINALGSYVHTSRLQYIEFFGKFFESGGKAFAPLQAKTKYTYLAIEEEN